MSWLEYLFEEQEPPKLMEVRRAGIVVSDPGGKRVNIYRSRDLSVSTLETNWYKIAKEQGEWKAWQWLKNNAQGSPYNPERVQQQSQTAPVDDSRPVKRTYARMGNPESPAKTNKAIKKAHNQKAYYEAKDAIEKNGRCCIIQATGTGKSSVFTSLCDDYSDLPCVFMAPSDMIREQFVEHNSETEDHPANDVVLKGNLHTFNYQTILAGYQNDEPPFRRLKEELGDTKIGLVCLDELHKAGAPAWSEALRAFLEEFTDSTTVIVGASATPDRDDGSDPSEEFCGGVKVSNLSLEDAINQGALPMPNYYSIPQIDEEDMDDYDKQIKRIEPEYQKECKAELDKIIGKYRNPELQDKRMGLMVDKLREIGEDKFSKGEGIKLLSFCTNKEDAKSGVGSLIARKVQEAFPDKIVKVYTDLSGEGDSESRDFASDFQKEKKVPDEEVWLLQTVEKYNEGLHAEGVDTVILGRATNAQRIYDQQCGRALAAVSEAKPTIFDMVANSKKSVHNWEDMYKNYREHNPESPEREVHIDTEYEDAMKQAQYCIAHYRKDGNWRYGKVGDKWVSTAEIVRQKANGAPGKMKYYNHIIQTKIKDEGYSYSRAIRALDNLW